jgi:hypothetical protein
MKKIAIIGAGQLGSRHLQSLAQCEFKVKLYIVDPSNEALQISKERFDQIPKNSNVENLEFFQNIEKLPNCLDLVVIATNANVRLKVIQELIEHSNVSYLILEKVLFQSIQDYQIAQDLFLEKKITAWVNCPRRMYPIYQNIRKYLDDKPVHYEVNGVDWGLACNSIHFIDHLAMYTNNIEYTIETEGLEPLILQSKRKGFVEFIGKLTGRFSDGDTFSLSSQSGNKPWSQQKFSTDTVELTISEGKGIVEVIQKSTKEKSLISFTTPYQSNLTQLVAKDIFDTGNCLLTPYEQSMKLHIPLLKGLMQFMEKLDGKPIDVCPIT